MHVFSLSVSLSLSLTHTHRESPVLAQKTVRPFIITTTAVEPTYKEQTRIIEERADFVLRGVKEREGERDEEEGEGEGEGKGEGERKGEGEMVRKWEGGR